ncbi:SusC/RagA family TonB-linked outer membrane protein [Flavobacterium sp. J27]|uniref:SusC/RagA family TonB-linked outer membrane protein n=1 Tax=Flavobacterium sp. J27 TaxID=2060419 RepID=UPI0010319A64|nr:SusC/RagA family TonB-linked outer membrane protein [Flavobacterium sp. J27]
MKTLQKKLFFLMLVVLPLGTFAQNILKGRVLDSATQSPLPSVNISVANSNSGTSTDFDGNFMLSNLSDGDQIIFSYVGFVKQTFIYKGQTEITILMTEDANQLEGVVVIGYGSVKKEDATGSLVSVTAKDFNKGAIVSADQLLTGKVAGVRITTKGGQPDSAPNIRIRGGSSLNANSSPLIVIDGIPVDNTTQAGVSNPLSFINPNDIESFTVLKDASASAIYGSRASNGVIIITTKKGTSGEAQYNYSANVSVSKVGKKIEVMNGSDFTKFIQQYHPTYTNFLGIDDPNSTATDDLSTPNVIEGRILFDTDWQDAIYRTAISTDHNFSAKANLYKVLPMRASVSYTKNEGIVKTNDYERYNYSLKLSPKLFKDHLKIDANARLISVVKNSIDEDGALGGAIKMDPTKPLYDYSASNRFGGYYQDLVTNSNNISGQYNPLALLEQRSRPERVLRFLGNMEFDYKMHFLPDLRAVLNLGIDASKARIRELYTDNALATYRVINSDTDFIFNPGINYLENQKMTNVTMDSYLAYSKSFDGFLNKFDIQGGYSYQNFKNDGNKEIYRYNLTTGLREVQPNVNNPNNRYYNVLNLQSFFGRANIDLANKYLLTVTFRADASSLFREDKRWGYFPSAALAWKLKQESFLTDVSFVNDAKIRIGVGKTGQQDITATVGFYPSTPLFNVGSTSSQYLQGSNLYSALAFNEDLTWEKTTTYNLGLDFDFFKDSFLSGSFDIYKKETKDLLARVPLPPGQGLTDTFVKNVGSTEGKGFELNLNFKPLKEDDFNLDVYTNLAYTYIKVTDLKDVDKVQAGGNLPTGTGVNIADHVVGLQPYSFWVFEQLYDVDGNVIPGAFVDRNGDHVINNDDRYYKAARPNWTFGFGLNFNYKNWDLSSSWRGQFGGQVYNSRKLTSGWVDSAIPTNNNSLSNVLDFYSGEADLAFQNYNGNATFSDYFLEDATFLRCENIILGYKFNKLIKSSTLRVYGALNNPFLITKYTGQDPENFNAIDTNFYPRPKSYTFGLSMDF